MITRKNLLLDTFVDVENGGEGVDTAIRKLDKEFDNVIEGANTTQTELDAVKKKVTALDEINHEGFALKSEIPEIVGSRTVNVEVAGRENKISVNLPLASSQNPDPGLMTQNDKMILENLRNTGETFAGHVVNEDIHVPEWTAPQDVGKVLKLTESGAEWSMGTGPEEFEGVFSLNGLQDTVLLEGEGTTQIRTEGKGKIKISTPVPEEATIGKSGLMSASDKGKLNSIPSIPIPKEEDKGKALVYKEDGSLSWETQASHYIGEIFAYAGTTPPTGAVECKGQAMSKKAYPDLFEVIGYNFGGSDDLFCLPDTYTAGRFLRSRSVSVPVGMEQGDATRRITGGLPTGTGRATIGHNGVTTGETKGAVKIAETGTALLPTAGANGKNFFWEFDSALVVPTADENRPINVSVMYCIQIAHGYFSSTMVDMTEVVKEIDELKSKIKTHYIGEIFAYAGATPPTGAVECRGQAMSKSTHPDLFAVIGYNFGGSGDTFYLPDTYGAGRFLRSRSEEIPVGTKQGDAIRNIKGTLQAGALAGYSWPIGTATASGAFYPNGTGDVGGLSKIGSNYNSLGFDASKVVPTADENRSINLSVMYCIQVTHGYVNTTQIDVVALMEEVIGLRNKIHYPPMFIQGFNIEYINSNLVHVSEGLCRDFFNKNNIEFNNHTGCDLEIKGYTTEKSIHIFCVLKSDETIIFKHQGTTDYILKEKEIAYRRIGTLIWEDKKGIVPYKSFVKGCELVFNFKQVQSNFNWTGSSESTTSPYTESFSLTAPEIDCTAHVYTISDTIDVGAWPTSWLYYNKSATPIILLSSSGGIGIHLREKLDLPLPKDDQIIKISVTTIPNLKAHLNILTYGYTDWRVD